MTRDVTHLQVWYADDACACGSIVQLHQWWEHLCKIGPGYGHFVNVENTWLLTKSDFQSAAIVQFGMNVTCEDRPYLGAVMGNWASKSSYTRKLWMIRLQRGLLRCSC